MSGQIRRLSIRFPDVILVSWSYAWDFNLIYYYWWSRKCFRSKSSS